MTCDGGEPACAGAGHGALCGAVSFCGRPSYSMELTGTQRVTASCFTALP